MLCEVVCKRSTNGFHPQYAETIEKAKLPGAAEHPPLMISVIMPVRDAASTVERAVHSILGQSERDLELIAVDDGSSDGTAAILDRLASGDGRLRVFHRKALGIVDALNHGIGNAAGSLIARMDGDDLSHQQRLELQHALLDARPELGLVSCLADFGGDPEKSQGFNLFTQWINSVIEPEEISLYRFVESPVAHPTVMFRAELPKLHGPYRNGDFPEDYELWLRWMQAGVRMGKVTERLLVWKDSEGRLSRTDPRYRAEAFYLLKAQYLAAWLRENNPFHPAVWVAGAGRQSRRRSEMLLAHGVEIKGYFDVDPAKIGTEKAGRPVLSYDGLPAPGKIFVIPYVAKRGVSREIQETLESRGYRLGKDFIPAA